MDKFGNGNDVPDCRLAPFAYKLWAYFYTWSTTVSQHISNLLSILDWNVSRQQRGGGLRETFKQMSLQQNRSVSLPSMTDARWEKRYAYGMLEQRDIGIQEQSVNVT